MGQYYKPINLRTKEWVFSHDYGNGLKLMEHSWIGNNFVGIVEVLLSGAWRNDPIVWAGDYADDEKVRLTDEEYKLLLEEGYTLKSQKDTVNLYALAFDNLKIVPFKPVDYEQTDAMEKEMDVLLSGLIYIVNHDKKLFVDKTKVPKGEWGRIHPLPLLTCEGNGRGGGDYRENEDSPLIGAWARDHLSVDKIPPKGYEELIFDLTEGISKDDENEPKQLRPDIIITQ